MTLATVRHPIALRIELLRLIYRTEGWRALLRAIARFVFRSTDFQVFSLELDQEHGEADIPAGYELEIVSPEEMKSQLVIHDIKGWDYWRPVADGVSTLAMAKYEGVPIHVNWIYTSSDRNCNMLLSPNECELSFSYTDPAHRGQGLQGISARLLAKSMAALGYKRLYALIVIGNIASERGLKKCGLKRVGSFRQIWVCGYRYVKILEKWNKH